MVNLKNCLTAGVLLYGAVFALYGNSLIGGNVESDLWERETVMRYSPSTAGIPYDKMVGQGPYSQVESVTPGGGGGLAAHASRGSLSERAANIGGGGMSY